MRILTAAIVVAGLAGSLLLGSAGEARNFTGIRYQAQGEWGLLTITNAEGQPFWALDAAGQTVASGTVTSGSFNTLAKNVGPDASGALLRVRVGDGPLIAVVVDPDWLWD